MPHTFLIKFGPVNAELRFDSELTHVAAIIRYWLGAGLCQDNRQPHIIFTLTTKGISSNKSQRKQLSGDGWCDRGFMGCWDRRGWENRIYQESINNEQCLHWECHTKTGLILAVAKRTPSSLVRLLHQHYFSYPEMLASTFLYRQLIPAIQIALLRKKASLIHSSAVKHAAGSGVLVSGWGGSGKTSASSYLYLNNPKQWQYLSDDLAIVDITGHIHLSPIPINIFPYNTQHFSGLKKNIVEKMSIFERAQWVFCERFLGLNSVARRIPPLDSSELPSTANLELAIHLQRYTGLEPAIKKCSSTVLAKIAKNILLYELRHGWTTYLLANAFSAGKSETIPSPDELAISTERILQQAFAKAQLAIINIPKDYSPIKVSKIVERLAK